MNCNIFYLTQYIKKYCQCIITIKITDEIVYILLFVPSLQHLVCIFLLHYYCGYYIGQCSSRMS